LAAANPVFGRYNKKKSPEENIDLPAALMSRFDLLFILVDTPERDYDTDLARHICYVHQHGRHPPLDFDALPASFIR
jgi:DNA replication licensing factor MCM7